MAMQFEQAAQDYIKQFPALSVHESTAPKEDRKKNVWQSTHDSTGPPKTILEDATVATTTSSVTHSTKVTNDLQSLRKNIRKVAFSHKHLEAAFV